MFLFLRNWDYGGWSVNYATSGIWARRAQTFRLASNPTYSLTIVAMSHKEVLPTPYTS